MTPSQRILEAALRYQTGGLNVFDSEPYKCLKVVRLLMQEALGLSYDAFYARYRTKAVDGRAVSAPGQPDFDPWARDVQLSLRDSPYAVPAYFDECAPGDLVFAWDLGKPQGHVALIVNRAGGVTEVIENTGSERGRLVSGYNRQSRLEDWPTQEFEVFRLVEP